MFPLLRSALLLLSVQGSWSRALDSDVNSHPLKGDGESGYVAEWSSNGDFIPHIHRATLFRDSASEVRQFNSFPSLRQNAATWVDANGTWWLFGGRGPNVYHHNANNQSATSEFLSDIWAYNLDDMYHWTPIFRPIHQTPTPLSSYPEDLHSPLLCGSSAFGHLAVFDGNYNSAPFGTPRREVDPIFPEDNTVWLYDIPRQAPLSPSRDGLWTSYICCDACLPDQNTTLEFCPHFKGQEEGRREMALMWCSSDALMALQPTNQSTNHNSSQLIKAFDWWQFDLETTEWLKVATLSINMTFQPDALFPLDCRSASHSFRVYVLCPVSSEEFVKTGRAQADIFILDIEKKRLDWLERIPLNVAFEEVPLWKNGSILSVVESTQETLILLAYRKLLDVWRHDHFGGKLEPLENVWTGTTLYHFLHSSSFYHLHITFSNNATKEVFLLNPRQDFLHFNQSNPRALTFHVTIKPRDVSLFLPPRTLNEEFELPHQDKSTLTQNSFLSNPREGMVEEGANESAAPHFFQKSDVVPIASSRERNLSQTTAISQNANEEMGKSLDVRLHPTLPSELEWSLRRTSSLSSLLQTRDALDEESEELSLLPFLSNHSTSLFERSRRGGRKGVIVKRSQSQVVAINKSTNLITTNQLPPPTSGRTLQVEMEQKSASLREKSIMDSARNKNRTEGNGLSDLDQHRPSLQLHSSLNNSEEEKEWGSEEMRAEVLTSHSRFTNINFHPPTTPTTLHLRTPPHSDNHNFFFLTSTQTSTISLNNATKTKMNHTATPFGESGLSIPPQETQDQENRTFEVRGKNESGTSNVAQRDSMTKNGVSARSLYLTPDDTESHMLTPIQNTHHQLEKSERMPNSEPLTQILFFAMSIVFFCGIGILLFIRTCVNCSPPIPAVITKEPPSVSIASQPMEDDICGGYNHLPIV